MWILKHASGQTDKQTDRHTDTLIAILRPRVRTLSSWLVLLDTGPMHLVYCADVIDRLGKSASRLLSTAAELKSELEKVATSKDRALESLRDQETSSRFVKQRCRELETSCAELQGEQDKLLQQIAQLQHEAGT